MAQARRATAGARSGSGKPASSGKATNSARPSGGLAAHTERLRGIVEPIVNRAGYDLEDLSVARAGRRSVLRVTVDGEAGVDHDALAVISRDVSAALDASEESGGAFAPDAYELEVSSPGVDRPLTLPRHWRRNIGRLVTVKASGRLLTGRIMAADADTVVLDVGGRRQEIPRPELGPGRVQVEFRDACERNQQDCGRVAELDESAGFDEGPAESAQIGDQDEEGVDRP
jgi:ribosome maturation factor RimP